MLWVLFLQLGMMAQALPKTASMTGNTASLSVGPGSAFSPQYGDINLWLTSFDGSSRFPLAQNIGGAPYFGRELQYYPGVNPPFQADYVLISSVGAFEYGTLGLNLQVGDGNQDGIPDLLQPEFSGTGGFNGQTAPDAPSLAGYTVGGFFTRDANRADGTYSINLNGTAAGRLTFTGQFRLVTWKGTLSYQRGPETNNASLDLTQTQGDGSTVRYTGATTFTVPNINQLVLAGCTLTNIIGQSIQSGPMLMTRNGNRYVGGLAFNDGSPITSWQDYANVYFSLLDTNDANGDGVPDLTSPYDPPPVILTQPASLNAPIGSTVTLGIVYQTATASSVQWLLNGIPLPGATQPTLTLTDVQLAQGGAYKAVVTNRGGAVISAEAILRVLIPPAITSDPAGLALDEKSTATFSVAVTGSLPLVFQWRFNGTNLVIPSATTSTLTLTNINAASAGVYDVVVTNDVGRITSATARLVVSTAPVITTQPDSLAVLAGGSAAFRVVATGTPPLRYQWKLNGTNIPGALSSELRLSNLKATQAGPYQVVVSNRLGDTPSDTVLLTVIDRLLMASKLSDGSFQLKLTGETGRRYAVESSTNLTAWTTVTNFPVLDGPGVVVEPNVRARPQLFYRARSL